MFIFVLTLYRFECTILSAPFGGVANALGNSDYAPHGYGTWLSACCTASFFIPLNSIFCYPDLFSLITSIS